MKTFRLRRLPLLLAPAIAALLPACSPKPPEGPIEFTLPALATGDTVRTTILSSFRGGTFSASSPDAETSGSLSMERRRIVEKVVTESGDDGPTRSSLTVPEDTAKVTILSSEGSRMDTIEGPLVGLPIEATRNGATWSLELTDRVAGAEQADALLGIESFENRRWFPDRPVALGESWEYDPVYFRALVERDLGNATAKGRMTLRALENHSDGSAQARLELEITSSGENDVDGNLERRAAIEARGTLIVDLETMLDRSMIIEGTIRSGAANGTSQASLEIPLRIEALREILPK